MVFPLSVQKYFKYLYWRRTCKKNSIIVWISLTLYVGWWWVFPLLSGISCILNFKCFQHNYIYTSRFDPLVHVCVFSIFQASLRVMMLLPCLWKLRGPWISQRSVLFLWILSRRSTTLLEVFTVFPNKLITPSVLPILVITYFWRLLGAHFRARVMLDPLTPVYSV